MFDTLRAVKRRLLGVRPETPIAETTAVFDTEPFLEKTKRLKDPLVRQHALDVIERGFTVVPDSVPGDLLDAAVRSFGDWKQRNRGRFLPGFYKFDDKLDRIIDIQATLPIFQRLFSHNRSLRVQDHLFQDRAVLYSSLLFEVGTAQSIHRDIPLFWTKPAHMYFGTWTALEDTDAANGPLVVIPGSHRLPLLDRDAVARERYSDLSQIKDIDDDLWTIYQERLSSLCREKGLAAEEVHVRKGDTIIWHPLLAHGGAAIRDRARTRLSVVVHTTPKNVPVFHTNVFFNVNRPVPDRAPWTYEDVEGRLIKRARSLSIGHAHRDFDFSMLR
jgi:hypothetical protein